MQRQEEQLKKKQDLREKKEQDIIAQKNKNQEMRTSIQNGIEGKRQDKMRQIMEEAALLKAQKEVNKLFKSRITVKC